MLSQLLDHLKALRMPAAAKELAHQFETPASWEWSFEQRLAKVLDAERAARLDRRVEHFDRRARKHLPESGPAEIAGLDYRPERGLSPPRMKGWAQCDWVHHRQDFVLTGGAGAGKTFIALALGKAAERQGLRVEPWSLPELLDHVDQSKIDGTAPALWRQLTRAHLLILDDFLLDEVHEPHSVFLRRLVVARRGKGSTLFASPIPLADWHTQIKPALTADAIVDRVRERAQRLVLKGPSYRAKRDAT